MQLSGMELFKTWIVSEPNTSANWGIFSEKLRISTGVLNPHKATNCVSAIAISGLWFSSKNAVGFFLCNTFASSYKNDYQIISNNK